MPILTFLYEAPFLILIRANVDNNATEVIEITS